jgi:hypothetical protein
MRVACRCLREGVRRHAHVLAGIAVDTISRNIPLGDELPNIKRWFNAIQARPAVTKGYAVMEDERKSRKPMDDKTRAMYFGQTAAVTHSVRSHERGNPEVRPGPSWSNRAYFA